MTEQLVVQPDYTDDSLLRPIQAAPESPTPVENDGSFLSYIPAALTQDQHYKAIAAYNHYIGLDKGLLVSQDTILLSAYEMLKTSPTPSHQSAAGWAAIELAMMASRKGTAERLELFDAGLACWNMAARLYDKHSRLGVLHLTNGSNAVRLQMNIAIAALPRAEIAGEADEALRRKVFLHCLEVANRNYELGLAASSEEESGVRRDHAGFSVENLVMLGDNQNFKSRRYTMPSSLRAGDGWFRREFTHDLVRVNASGCRVHMATPIEVKTIILPKHIERYKALLIGRRRDLAIESKPIEYFFEALGAVATEEATDQQRRTSKELARRIGQMVSGYERRRRIGPRGSATIFHKPEMAAAI